MEVRPHAGLAHARIVPILAGGGTRLPAHVGVLAALRDLGVTYDHLVGVSGGSIIAALWAVGKDVAQLSELFHGQDFRRFRGFSIYHLLTQCGLSTGQDFLDWLDGHLNGMRFGDLRMNLHVVATDIMSGQPVIFDSQRTPEVRLAEAVRASMGIPLLFTYRKWGDAVLVDGSILAEDVLRRNWAGDGTTTCCFRLEASALRQGRRLNRRFPLPDYLALLLRTFMTTLSREYISDLNWNTTVVVDCGNISPVEFSLSRMQKAVLYEKGYQTTMEILPKKLSRILTQEAEELSSRSRSLPVLNHSTD